MKDKETIGKMISEARKNMKITQQELAKRLNVTDKAISNWETGKNYPDFVYLKELTEILNIDFYSLQEDKNKKKEKTLIVILLLLIFPIIVLSSYFIFNYNSFSLYKVELNDKNIIIEDAYISKSKTNLIVSLGEIKNTNNLIQPEYDIVLYYKTNNKKYIITEQKEHHNLIINLKDKNIIKNIENLYITIDYINHNGTKKKKDYKIELNLIESNNKLIYFYQEDTTQINKNQRNLLENNGYTKINKNIYQKETKDELFQYNPITRIMTYTKTLDDYKIMLEYDASSGKEEFTKYAVITSDAIEEYNLKDPKTINNTKILEEIKPFYKIIQEECEKIITD